MTLRIAAALALALAAPIARAGEPIVPLAGETATSFQCRAAIIPTSRACIARCEVEFAGAERADGRFECVDACTKKGLGALSRCRAGEPIATASLAAR